LPNLAKSGNIIMILMNQLGDFAKKEEWALRDY
jgi:hypothetical protein